MGMETSDEFATREPEQTRAKYDVAISTACPGLDYIVVETTAAAQACVELLRREQLGIATFMILDERMELAFYASLGNTIVAKDLDQQRISTCGNAYGALFERSGTMSGGGSKPRGGKMGTSIRANSVSRETVIAAEKELANMVDSLNTIRKKIDEAIRNYQASEKVVAELEMEIAKSQKEVDSLNSEYKYLEKQLDSLEAASRPKQDEISRLEELKKIISTEEKEIDRIIQGSKKLKEKASDLQNKIENAGGERLKTQKSKVEKIQSDIDKNSTDINRHKVQIETGEKMVKKLTKGIEESKKEKERIVEGKDKMHDMFKEIEQKAFTVQENYKKVQKVDSDFKLQDMKKMYKM
ncbi:hypothetical protein V6N11_014683 [Hibiscus sabdariffa]|uniref:SMC hinge domain-containing protein n=1 Tax=Hibiscus sabdariffa TaxID=183260 RepID=A0ABR2TPT5_9ROSI